MKRCVLVLDGTGMPINTITAKQAFKKIGKSKSDTSYTIHVISTYESQSFNSQHSTDKLPAIIQLGHKIRLNKTNKRQQKLSRKGVWLRDKGICQYCGTKIPYSKMHWDHVVPIYLGGESTWTNLVCSCLSCNKKKSNYTLDQCGMKLLSKPRIVMAKQSAFECATERLCKLIDTLPHESWEPYVGWMLNAPKL